MSTVHIYTDGSRAARFSGGGIAILHHHDWKYFAFSFDNDTTSDEAKCKATLKGLEAAVSLTASTHHGIADVLLYTDSQTVLKLLNMRQEGERTQGGSGHDLVDECFVAMTILAGREVEVEVLWVKGHLGIDGNEYADVLASMGSKMARRGVWNSRHEVSPEEFDALWKKARSGSGRGVPVRRSLRYQQLSESMDDAEVRERQLEGRVEAMDRSLQDQTRHLNYD